MRCMVSAISAYCPPQMSKQNRPALRFTPPAGFLVNSGRYVVAQSNAPLRLGTNVKVRLWCACSV